MVPAVKLALAVGIEALFHAGREPSESVTVFASSSGDGETVHQICEALATPEREVSPTCFHNSVHNAPSGYWGIATRSHQPSTSLCAYDASFAAGLLDAAAQTTADGCAVTLIAYDLPFPEPLQTACPIGAVFGTALVLTPNATPRSFARLGLEVTKVRGKTTRLTDTGLEALRITVPAARSLPLLEALSSGSPSSVILDCHEDFRLYLDVFSC